MKTTPKTPPKPPRILGKHGREFWKSVLAAYDLQDEHHLKLLEHAAVCLDRIAAAQATIAAEGITEPNRFGEAREHHALATERASMTAFKSHVRELGLDLETAPAAARGPRRPGSRD